MKREASDIDAAFMPGTYGCEQFLALSSLERDEYVAPKRLQREVSLKIRFIASFRKLLQCGECEDLDFWREGWAQAV